MVVKMIKDSEFISSKDVPGPTKEEIRCITLCKSRVKKDDIVMDIGCGTGGLTVELSKKAKKVISVDKNKEAIELTKKNLAKLSNFSNVELINTDGLTALKNIEKVDIIMVGGSGGDLDQILEIGKTKLNKKGRIIINAILLETKVEAMKKLKELDFKVEFVEISVSKGKILERGTMLLAQNPISIIYTV